MLDVKTYLLKRFSSLKSKLSAKQIDTICELDPLDANICQFFDESKPYLFLCLRLSLGVKLWH